MYYNFGGVPIEEGRVLSQAFDHENSQAVKTAYLAQTPVGTVRGKPGFMCQTNFRPFDDRSFEFQSADSDAARTANFRVYDGKKSGLWCIVDYDGDHPGQALGNIKRLRSVEECQRHNLNVVGVLADSFAERHTCLWYARDVAANMNFSLERVVHYEGIPDVHKKGFAHLDSAALPPGTSTLSVVASIKPDGIFNGYQAGRMRIVRAMMDGTVPKEGLIGAGSFWEMDFH